MFSEEELKEFNVQLKDLLETSSRNAKKILHDILHKVLLRTNHVFVDLSHMTNTCFDIIAKKENRLIVIKIEPYIDNFDKNKSLDLKNLASFLNASPIIIGVRGRRFDEIHDGLVLFRYDMPVVSPETFLNLIIDGLPPIIYCNRGGYFVRINRNILRRARIDKNLSYNSLAQKIGVSRRTVYEYEHSINPPPEIALKLEDVLDVSLAQGIPILELKLSYEETRSFSTSSLSPLKEEIAQLLAELGIFTQFWIQKMPFDAFGEHQNKENRSGLNVLLCVDEGDENEIMQRVNLTQRIASLTKRRPVMVVEEEEEHPASKHIPTFTIEELQEMKRAFQLVKEYMKKYASLKESLGN
ncbi:MAG: helix-turn-helix domain-containing protein [Candidatus Heimdallarchaeaceae archaeon]